MKMTNVENRIRLVPLHKFPEFKEECASILNKQWPRSNTLRYRSLNASCDKLPTSLVLIDDNQNTGSQVIGHARLNMIPNEEDSVWIESVIIHHDKRKQGYGRVLMTKTEEFAACKGFKNAVLSTHGEEEFYKRLGYEFCSPVCLFGGPVNTLFLPKTHFNINKKSGNICQSIDAYCETKNLNNNNNNLAYSSSASSPSPPPPPPPPPPIAKLKKTDIQRIDTKTSKLYMRKSILKDK